MTKKDSIKVILSLSSSRKEVIFPIVILLRFIALSRRDRWTKRMIDQIRKSQIVYFYGLVIETITPFSYSHL
jgi:hypothetical protein